MAKRANFKSQDGGSTPPTPYPRWNKDGLRVIARDDEEKSDRKIVLLIPLEKALGRFQPKPVIFRTPKPLNANLIFTRYEMEFSRVTKDCFWCGLAFKPEHMIVPIDLGYLVCMSCYDGV